MPRVVALLAAVLALIAAPRDGAAQGNLPHLSHNNVELIAKPPAAGASYDVSILEPQKGLENLRAALDLLMRRSPVNADAIETLKKSGRVIIVYDPAHPPRQAAADGIAAFFPYFFRRREDGGEGDFLVVVGRHGIKWPTNELAAVIAHELAGHGMQRLRGERESMRELERECEAQLYQEKAVQDLGVDKSSTFMTRFRARLENHYCSDFKHFQAQRRPETLRLWDVRDPDVVRLLAVFREHLKDLRERGLAGAAVNAERKQHEDRVREQMEDADPERMYRLGMGYAAGGKGVPHDYRQAAIWFGKAAARGHAGAQYSLGILHEKGLGTWQDPGEAAKWYRMAADQGVPEAQFSLASAYAAGRGVQHDAEESYFWLNLAAARGSGGVKTRATELRDKLAADLSPEQKSRVEGRAAAWRPEPQRP